VEGIGFILNPANRKSLSKVVFGDEWSNSVVESFGDSEDIPRVLSSHQKDVESIKSKLGSDLLEFVSTCLPLGHDESFKKFTHESTDKDR